MQRSDWIRLVQVMQGHWPHAPLSDSAIDIQYGSVEDTNYEAASAALKDLLARDFPPNAAQIAKRAGELIAEDLPDFDQVRPAFMALGHDRDRFPELDKWQAKGYHPVFRVYFTKQRWKQWCDTSESDTTFVAQQRDEWRSLTGRSKRDLDLLIAGIDREALRKGDGLGKLAAAGALGLPSGDDEDSES